METNMVENETKFETKTDECVPCEVDNAPKEEVVQEIGIQLGEKDIHTDDGVTPNKQEVDDNQKECSEELDPYAYLQRPEFSSENFKIEIMNLPIYYGVGVNESFIKLVYIITEPYLFLRILKSF